MPSVDRAALIERYAAGPAELSAALAEVPAAARTWRPNPGCWSAHEVVLHCADSETNAHMRIRYLVAESAPAILGYDQDRWAVTLDYHHLPLEPALATVVAVRGNTIPLLRRLSHADWARTGRHTESGSYSADTWLGIYSEHLHQHARQIRRGLEAWQQRGPAAAQ